MSWGPRQVSIIIPFRDRYELLDECLRGLEATASSAEIILVDNGSCEARTKRFLDEWKGLGRGLVVSAPGPFNFSRLCNTGAAASRGAVLLFLNNDVWPMEMEWLEAMLQVAGDQRVGIVGATLLYPDHKIQHVGILPTGRGGTWEHVYRFQPHDHPGREDELLKIRAVPAVTGACMLIRRDVFECLGRFDERFAITFNDVDLCQRAWAMGLTVAVTPHARLWHLESISRGWQREAA